MKRIYIGLLILGAVAGVRGQALTARNEQYYNGITPKELAGYFVNPEKIAELFSYVDNPSGDAATATVSLEKAEIELAPNGKYFVRMKLPGGLVAEQAGSIIAIENKNPSIGVSLNWTGRHFDQAGNLVLENKSVVTIFIYEDPHRTGAFVRIDSEGLSTPEGLAALNEGWDRIYLLPIYNLLHSHAKAKNK